MNYLEALSRRYSVKKFNAEIIPRETLQNWNPENYRQALWVFSLTKSLLWKVRK